MRDLYQCLLMSRRNCGDVVRRKKRKKPSATRIINLKPVITLFSIQTTNNTD